MYFLERLTTAITILAALIIFEIFKFDSAKLAAYAALFLVVDLMIVRLMDAYMMYRLMDSMDSKDLLNSFKVTEIKLDNEDDNDGEE